MLSNFTKATASAGETLHFRAGSRIAHLSEVGESSDAAEPGRSWVLALGKLIFSVVIGLFKGGLTEIGISTLLWANSVR